MEQRQQAGPAQQRAPPGTGASAASEYYPKPASALGILSQYATPQALLSPMDDVDVAGLKYPGIKNRMPTNTIKFQPTDDPIITAQRNEIPVLKRESMPIPKIQSGQGNARRVGILGSMNAPLPSIIDISINRKPTPPASQKNNNNINGNNVGKNDRLTLTSLNTTGTIRTNGFASTLSAPSMIGVNPDKLSKMAEPLIYADKKHIIPGVVPYQVALERRKRELAKETLTEHLFKHQILIGYDDTQRNFTRNESQEQINMGTELSDLEFEGVNTEKYVSSPLPLALFDFGIEEIRSPRKWAKYAKQIDQNSGVSLNSRQMVLYGECLTDPQYEISEDGRFINPQIHIKDKNDITENHRTTKLIQWKNCVMTKFVFLSVGEHKEKTDDRPVYRSDNVIDFNDFVDRNTYPPDCIDTNGKTMYVECILRIDDDDEKSTNMKTKRYLLPRVLVFLWGESGEDFAIRLRRCLEFRILTEQRIRLKLYISGMPTEGLLAMSPTSINRIKSEVIPLLPEDYTLKGLGRASTKTSISIANAKLETFIDDMVKEHLTTQNSIIMMKYIDNIGEAEAKELKVEKAMWWEEHKEDLESGLNSTTNSDNVENDQKSYKEQMRENISLNGSLPWWWYVDTKPAFEHIANIKSKTIEKYGNFKSAKSLFELTTLYCGRRPIYALLHTQNECWKASRCYPMQKDIRDIVTNEEQNDSDFPFRPYEPVPIPVHCIYAIPGAVTGFSDSSQSIGKSYMGEGGDSGSLYSQSLSSTERFILNPIPAYEVKTLSLTDFINFNNNKITSEKAFISDILINYIKQKITADLNNVEPREDKGWFNLDISNFDVYNTSKLKRLLMRVNFMIGQCVREIVEKSTNAFRDALSAGKDWKVNVINECSVDNHHIDNRAWWLMPDNEGNSCVNEEKQRCICLRRGPIFNIDIIIESIQANEFDYLEMQSLQTEYRRLDNMKNKIKEIISNGDNDENNPSGQKDDDEEENGPKSVVRRGSQSSRASVDQEIPGSGSMTNRKSSRAANTSRFATGRKGADSGKQQNDTDYDGEKIQVPNDAICPTVLYNVSPSDYLTSSLSILQENIRQLYRIETIEPALMQNLLWPPSNNANNNCTFISCPRVEEQFVQDAIKDIRESFERAINSLEQYKETFSCYRRITILDVNKWREIIRCRAMLGIAEENKNVEGDNKSLEKYGNLNGNNNNISVCKGEYSEEKDQTITNFSVDSPLKCSDLLELYFMLMSEHARISLRIPDRMHVGMFIVNNKGIKQHILTKRKQMADAVVDIIKEIAEMQSNKLIDEFNNIVLKIKRKNKEIEDVVEIEDTLNNIGKIEDKLKVSIAVVNRYYNLLDKISASLTGEAFKLRYKTFSLLKQLGEQIIQSKEILENDRTKFKENQKNQQVEFGKQIEQISRQTSTFSQRHTITYLNKHDNDTEDQNSEDQQDQHSPISRQSNILFGDGNEVDLNNINATCEESEMLFRQLRRMDEQAKLFNKREVIFGTEYTNYDQLNRIIKDFEPIYTVWKSIGTWYNNYNQWIHGPLTNIKPETVDRIVNDTFRSLSKSIRLFKKMPSMADMASRVKEEVGAFKAYLPLITAMCNPGMRYCHWKQLSNQIGIDIYPSGKKTEETEEEDEESTDETLAAELAATQYDDEGRYIGYTLQTAINTGLNNSKYLAQIQTISDIASKEYSIETALASIKEAWDSSTMNIIEYDTGGGNNVTQMSEPTVTYLLKGSDDIIQMIDDHSVLIQSMTFSPFKKRFEKVIHKWEVNLNLAGDIIEEWLIVQQNWLYLEPIFSSEDIQKQLPNEAKNFKTVDHQWRKMMSDAYRAKNLMKFISGANLIVQGNGGTDNDDETNRKRQRAALQSNSNGEKLLSKLKNNSELLEKIQKGLSDYIDMKRQLFPRFYFLSSDELLEILSQTKNPKAVQPFLRSCFENIQYVVFNEITKNESDGKAEPITELSMDTMVSLEGEMVDFERPVIPEGNVETWMKNLEQMMLNTVKHCIRRGYEEYRDLKLANESDKESKWRCDWVLSHPAQVVLCVTQIFFAMMVETALNENGHKGLEEIVEIVQKQLLDLAELSGTNLSKLDSKTMSSLLTIEVHARDILDQLLAQNVGSPNDFGWISLLRYYYVYDDKYDPESNVLSRRECKDCVVVKQVQTEWFYGYEYLGNTSRLVITPLTDRIYMTLMGALHLNLGGAPAGPAGTGKTETTKDLGKALAMAVIVFNCSDGLDYLSMGRFFTGLSMCGAWSCFDEFNRIDIEVLSVIAQQVLTIQQAIINVCSEAVSGVPRSQNSHPIVGTGKFMFEGKEITIKSTCAVFITMNPGYAGRTELPDNLQALFRPVACSVPDYELIAQVRLFSFGFKCAKNLSVKTTLTFRLSSEQLSSQDHYDFGMRALNTTLVAAGNRIKEAQSETQGRISELQEQQIMLRALLEVNTPKFLDQDVVLFNNIISDMFPGIPRQKVDYGALERELRYACIRLGYDFNDEMIGWKDEEKDKANTRFINKCIELYQTIELRHGLMTVGPTMSGKTAALFVLKNALDTLGKDATSESQYIPAHIFRLNPKAITMGQLYGQYDLTTHEWTDGILANLVRKAVHMGGVGTGGIEAPPSFRWIVFDGPVDALWIENMNTVLDDNKKLCLTSGEIIAMNNHMNMIFEVGDLAVASPATVSRCGMIYFSNETVDVQCMIGSYLGRIRGLLGYIKTNKVASLTPVEDVTPLNLDALNTRGNSNRNTSANATRRNLVDVSSTVQSKVSTPGTQLSPQETEAPGETAKSAEEEIDINNFQSCLNNSLSLCAYLFRLVPICIKFIRTGSADGMDPDALPLKEYIKSEDRNLLVSFFNMFESNLIDINKININKFNLSDTSSPYIYDSIAVDSKYLIDIFIFSLIYSVGNTCIPEERKRLSVFMVDLLITEVLNKSNGKLDGRSGWMELLKYLNENPDCGLTLYDFGFIICNVVEQSGEEGEESTMKVVPKWIHWNTINAANIKLNKDIIDEINSNLPSKNQKKSYINKSYLESIKSQQMSYNELLIPTGDTIRCKYVIDKLIKGGKSILAVGPTGTAKSCLLNQYLLAGGYCSDIDIETMLKDVVLSDSDKKRRMLEKEEQIGRFLPITFSFSAQTSANQLQDFVDEKLEKRRKGVFGPPNGKRFLLFIDDTNMPQKEVYFAQPPIELLRQMIDHGGWYDRKTLQFKNIVDTQVIGAMGPVGGGRTDITARFSRHFNYISFAEMNTDSLKTIFSTIMEWWITTGELAKITSGISFTDIIRNSINATIELYDRIKKELLPIPAKSHYTFNLRDISKVFQGIVTADSTGLFTIDNNKKTASFTPTYVRLWVHECTRVFSDRLVNNEDRTWFHNNVSDMISNFFDTTYNDIIKEREELVPQYEARFIKNDGIEQQNHDSLSQSSGLGDSILFGDFMFPNEDKKAYSEILSLKKMNDIVVEFLDDYNSQTKQPMPLVMFLNAMEHVTRILRILRQPGGHALLLGIGGSGRQSLTRLASHIADFETKQIEITKTYGTREWRDDLKNALLAAGLEDKDVVFLIVDTQLIHKTMLEDINMVLNTGDIPNLYEPAELDSINQTFESICRNKGLQPTKLNIFYQYLNRVRAKLHIVLAMSPMSNSFKDQIRMFPSLVNCCTIDWFTEWPDDALKSVAKDALNNVDFNNGRGKDGTSDVSFDEEEHEKQKVSNQKEENNKIMLDKIVSLCVKIHQSVFKASDLYMTQARRVSHVTPTKYLELLASFVNLEQKLRDEINTNIMRLSGGLEKLASTSAQVSTMQAELSALQPQLLKTSADVDAMMQQVQQDTARAAEAREIVRKEEAVASAKAKECAEIKEDAERDLAEALPALEVAVKALKLLSKSDLTEIRSFLNPPAGVKLCMEAVCIMFDMKPKMVDDPKKVGAKIEDYWSVSRNLLADPQMFLNSLFDYDKDNIKPSVIKNVTKYVSDTENFTPKAMERVSKAASGLCAWVIAMHKYYYVALAVAPKREKLAIAEKDFNEITAKLNETKQRLAQVEEQLASLQREYEKNLQEKESLGKKVDECEARLRRAEELLGGLGGEKDRWEAGLASWRIREKCVIGDAIIGAASVSYLGVFTSEFREELVHEWMGYLSDAKVQYTILEESNQAAAYTPPTITTLCDPVTIQGWGVLGLPTDSVSIENTILMTHSSRYPMLIDPQEQAQKFIKRLDSEKGIDVVKATDKDLIRTLENCVRFGRSLMILNCTETLDPTLEPVLLKQTFKQAGSDVISIGDQVIPFNPSFMLYLVTGNPNPQFAPETMARVNVLNFTVTPGGLEDQLLGTVVSKERPDLEEAKTKTVTSIAHMRQDLKDTENKILKMLAESTGNILDDEALISTLSESKAKSSEVAEKVKSAETTEKMIDTTREGYRPVAKRASVLYFCISSMKEVDPMYEYSLQWFMNVFVTSLTTATESSSESLPTSEEEALKKRLNLLNDHFTYMLYNTVCRSLFEKHKTLFSFLLSVKIKQGYETEEEKEMIKNGNTDYMKTIPQNYLSFFLHGTMRSSSTNPNPVTFISEQTWIEIETLASLGGHFEGLDKSFGDSNDVNYWRDVCLSDTPYLCRLPGKYEKMIAQRTDEDNNSENIPFMLLMLIKTLRPEKLLPLISLYITKSLGKQFIEPPTFDLSLSYRDTNPGTPLLFVLSSGADPTAALSRFSEEMRMSRKFVSISLGQGQGERAERMINSGAEKGMWVLLANCHLALSWMGKLEAIVERLQTSMNNQDSVTQTIHKDFRLFMTSMPTPKFPISILQNSVKVTNEPPNGLRSNLLRTYSNFDDKYLNESVQNTSTTATTIPKTFVFRKLLFALCAFHAVIQDRRKYGPLAFNIPYGFTDGDLDVCLRQMKMLVEDYNDPPEGEEPNIPFTQLRFLTGVINYGGRITDYHDQHTLNCILEDYITHDSVFIPNYKFSEDDDFVNPAIGSNNGTATIHEYVNSIKKLPLEPSPIVFGFSNNADITYSQRQANELIDCVMKVEGSGSSEENSSSVSIIENLLKLTPKSFDVQHVAQLFPTDYSNSMNTVVVQECQRYNKLTANMRSSLQELIKALAGVVVMSSELDAVMNSINANKVPADWLRYSFPSLKPLNLYMVELEERVQFISSWIKIGEERATNITDTRPNYPPIFFISRLFFPQAFLTGIQQNHARKYKLAIDTLKFGFKFRDELHDGTDAQPASTEYVDDGVLITGLYFEGSSWDYDNHIMVAPKPRELFCYAPPIQLIVHQKKMENGIEVDENNNSDSRIQIYKCPVYKTTNRAGVLSTTGHSTNFIFEIDVPTTRNPHSWTKAGVAMFCALEK